MRPWIQIQRICIGKKPWLEAHILGLEQNTISSDQIDVFYVCSAKILNNDEDAFADVVCPWA